MATTPEGKVKELVKKLLILHADTTDGWWPVPSGYGENWLDYQGCHRGLFFAIETKAGKGKLTALQRRVVARIERAGGRVFIIDGPDCEDMKRLKEFLE